jgi:hypothetical protein
MVVKMGRHTRTVVITEEGRDKGKTFLLKEMPALKAEKWATKLFLALSRSGVEIPDEIASAGLAGVAALGFRMLGWVSFADAEPLLDEMFSCVSIIPDPRNPALVRPLIDIGGDGDDIEEVSTRLRLRADIFNLHASFFIDAARSRLAPTQTSIPDASVAS